MKRIKIGLILLEKTVSVWLFKKMAARLETHFQDLMWYMGHVSPTSINKLLSSDEKENHIEECMRFTCDDRLYECICETIRNHLKLIRQLIKQELLSFMTDLLKGCEITGQKVGGELNITDERWENSPVVKLTF